MKKFLVVMMCLIMTVCFMPTMAFAGSLADGELDSADGAEVQLGSSGITRYFSTLQAAVNAAQYGDIITLLKDVDLGADTLTIDKAITLDGGSTKYSIMSTADDVINVMSIGGALDGSIVLKNLIINAVKDAKVRAITFGELAAPYTPITKMDLTVQNCEINTKQMGIVSYSDNNSGITLKVIDSIISMAGITDYDKAVSAGSDYEYSRGISLYQMGDSTVTLSGTTIQGFYYSLNNADLSSSDSMTVNVANSTFKCRAAINDWTDGTTWNISKSTVHGINTFTSSSEQFANIVLNDAAENNTVNINECTFTTYFSPEALANENALQHMVDARGANNKVYIDRDSSGSRFTSVSYDKGQVQKDSFGEGSSIEIYGGTFNVDPSTYVASGYKAVENGDGTWSIKLENPVAAIGDNEYADLQDAINAVSTNGTATTITMLANVTTDKGFIIAKGQNIILNLYNHSIQSSEQVRVITNNGTLTVTGPGTVACTKASNYGIGIRNYGVLSVDEYATVAGYYVAIENKGEAVLNGIAKSTAESVPSGTYAPIKLNDHGASLTIGETAQIKGIDSAIYISNGHATINSTNVIGNIYLDGSTTTRASIAKTEALNPLTLRGQIMTLEGENNYYSVKCLVNYPGKKAVLETDCTSGLSFASGKTYSLDLNGHTIETSGTALTVSGSLDLDLNGGLIKSTSTSKSAVMVNKTGTLTVNDSKSTGRITGVYENSGVIYDAGKLELNGGTVEGPMAITIFGNGTEDSATLKVDGATIIGTGYAITGNGTAAYAGTKIEITSGTITQHNDSNNGCAIYHPQDGVIIISGGRITGDTGVQLCSGEGVIANIGGTVEITGTAADLRSGKTGDGLIPDGAAVSVVNRSYPGGTPKMDISGGTFKSKQSKALMTYTWSNNQATNWENANEYLSITGGTFTSDPTAYKSSLNCYTVVKNDTTPETWTVTAGHTWDEGVITTEPTYDATGEKTYTCKVEGCGVTKTEVVPKKDRPYIPPTPTIPTTPTDNVTNSGSTATDNATTNADLSGNTSTSNGTTAATVDKTTADKIVDKAVENKSTEVVIDATANSTTAASSTTIAQVTIPTATIEAIAEKTEADVTIKTDVAEVKMDNAAAAAVSEQAEGDTVQIIAEKVAEETDKVEFELKVVCSDGKVISNFNGGNIAVTVALPKAMAEKKVVCVYIDDNGHMSKVEGQKNADGTYTFVTGHFSSYAILAEEEADAAIAAQKEAIKNIKIKLTSKQVKTKAGKKAVKITWTADAGDKVLDGVEVFRSKERYKGYGTEPFYTSTKGGNEGSYINTKSLKKGTKYYYRVRGYVLVDGQKVYTDYSTKAWRTVK